MLAAVDLGSNSFRLHIGMYDGERIRVVNTAREPVRLGAGLDANGYLTQKAMKTGLDCLARFAEVLRATQLTAVRVVGTNTLRVARNSADFIKLAEKVLGYSIEIISGEEEGRLIYMGVASAVDLPSERRLVVDIGGGSTELVLGQGHEIAEVESFSIGTVPVATRFFDGDRITAAGFNAAALCARSVFEDGLAAFQPKYWDVGYGSSGTMRTLAEIIEKNALGDGELSLQSLEDLRDRLIAAGRVNKIDLVGIKAERVAVILGGLPVLLGLAQELGFKSLRSIEAGLRMGVLWDLHLRQRKRDRRQDSIRSFMKRFDVDERRASQAHANAATLYEQLSGGKGTMERMLGWAAQIHEVGMMVSHTGFHKHGAYLALHADLPGFTTPEQHLLSVLVLAQKGNLRKVPDAVAQPEIVKAMLALRLGIVFMHARIDPAVEAVKLRKGQRIEIEVGRYLMNAHPTLAYWLAREQSAWEEAGVPFVVKNVG